MGSISYAFLVRRPGHNVIAFDPSDNYGRNQTVLVITDEQRAS